MKTIIFFTTPNMGSEEENLWPWQSSNEDSCNILSFSAPTGPGVEWNVIVYKTLGCDELYKDGWKYEHLKCIIRENRDSNECAVFMHTDPDRLSVLTKKFSNEERKNIVFLEYSGNSGYFPTHIAPFAQNPTDERLFKKLWEDLVENQKKESIIKQLCQLRYDLLVPLVTWDLLCEIDYDDNLTEIKQAMSASCIADEPLSELRNKFSELCSDTPQTIVGPNNLIASNYKIIRQWHQNNSTKSEKVKGLATLIKDCNQAILDKRS